LALGVSRGDSVWTSSITFVASANCALYCGAKIDFLDIDSQTYNMSVDQLSEKLAIAKINGNLPKVVIPVHLSGQSCDMARIYALSKQYDFKIIEDASHAIGGKYQNQPIGNCRYSDITVFSFHPVKIITTAEGGVATTNNPVLAKHMRLLRSHGITSNKTDMQPRLITEIWNYQQIDLGFNYRMTELQAALGLSQMQRLDEFVTKRNAIAQFYNEKLVNLPLSTPFNHPECYSAYHLYVIKLKLEETGKSQRQVYEALHRAGVLANLHYIPVYRHPYYEKLGFISGYCPEAEKYFNEAISIPMYPNLTVDQRCRVIEALTNAMSI
jgi:UDP-4-amino-4,6-dideoxy-N-acetyl-beta-L-altrosamine transaminase